LEALDLYLVAFKPEGACLVARMPALGAISVDDLLDHMNTLNIKDITTEEANVYLNEVKHETGCRKPLFLAI
jgi:hypothetical protein